MRARSLGFTGKMCIHPTQLETVERIFSPSDEALAKARRIVAEFEAALAKGIAAITVDGELVDPPIYDQAKKLLLLTHP
jgi:citrate lyase subunit beta / citryl-CoA lyase